MTFPAILMMNQKQDKVLIIDQLILFRSGY